MKRLWYRLIDLEESVEGQLGDLINTAQSRDSIASPCQGSAPARRCRVSFRTRLLRLFGCSRNPGFYSEGQLEPDRLRHFAHFVTAGLKAEYAVDLMKPWFNSLS
jgi:hypothetical protein